MNILFVSDAYLPTVSGVATSTDSIVRFMASRGHHVVLVCPRPLDGYIPTPMKGLEIVFTPGVSDALFVNKSYTIFPFGFGPLLGAFRSRKFDIAHIQEPGSLGVTAILLAKWYRVPMLGAMHFSWLQIERIAPAMIRWISVPFMKLYVRIVYHAFDAVMVPTRTAAKDLIALIGHEDRIYPVSNGVDTHIYTLRIGNTALLRKKYRLPTRVPIFLYIGRLDADKNIETILRAIAKIQIPAHFVIAGVGIQKASLEKLVQTLTIMDRITWFGEVQKQTILDLYQLADAFVIMSPVETQSIVALQAIACGLPLLAANAGALPELVHDGKNGYLVDTYDAEGLAFRMEKLSTDANLRESMGKASRKISLIHHKPKMLQQLESLYKKVGRHTI